MLIGILRISPPLHATKADGEDDGLHTPCPPETHFGWKPAGGAKYLRLKYQDRATPERFAAGRDQKVCMFAASHDRPRGNKLEYILLD